MPFKSQLTRPEKWLKRLFPSVANTQFSSPIPVAQRRVGLYAVPSPHESRTAGESVCAGHRREQMAPETADFRALAEPCLSPPSLLALPGTSLVGSSPPEPPPAPGRDGERVAHRALEALEGDTSPTVPRKTFHSRDNIIPSPRGPQAHP